MINFTPSIFTGVINSYLPEPHASLLNGMIFGADLKTSKVFYEQLKVVGLLHLVVLSGMNITLLSSIIVAVFSSLGKYLSSLLTILAIFIFIVFVGPEAPIIRAGFMGILTLVAFITGRKNFVFFSLFLSLVFIFLFFRHWLTSISLQLSYAATTGIILFGQTKEINADGWIKKIFHSIYKEFKLSLSAQIFTVPIIFIYFKQVSLISPLVNVLVAPLVAPIMVFGFLTAFLGKINFLLGLIPACICYGLLSYIVFVVNTLAKIPFAFFNF